MPSEEHKLVMSEIEQLKREVFSLETEKEKYQISLNEMGERVKMVNERYEKKVKESQQISDDNDMLKQAISTQNINFKQKIDTLTEEKNDLEDEVTRLIDLLKQHEAEKESETGIIIPHNP